MDYSQIYIKKYDFSMPVSVLTAERWYLREMYVIHESKTYSVCKTDGGVFQCKVTDIDQASLVPYKVENIHGNYPIAFTKTTDNNDILFSNYFIPLIKTPPSIPEEVGEFSVLNIFASVKGDVVPIIDHNHIHLNDKQHANVIKFAKLMHSENMCEIVQKECTNYIFNFKNAAHKYPVKYRYTHKERFRYTYAEGIRLLSIIGDGDCRSVTDEDIIKDMYLISTIKNKECLYYCSVNDSEIEYLKAAGLLEHIDKNVYMINKPVTIKYLRGKIDLNSFIFEKIIFKDYIFINDPFMTIVANINTFPEESNMIVCTSNTIQEILKVKHILNRYKCLKSWKDAVEIRNSLESIFPGNWDMKATGTPSLFKVMIKFPKLELTDSINKQLKYTVRDLYIIFETDEFKVKEIRGFRTTFTADELYYPFIHPYLPSLPGAMGVLCLGSSEFNDHFLMFNSDPRKINEKLDEFEYLLVLLEEFLCGTGGSPHSSMSDFLKSLFEYYEPMNLEEFEEFNKVLESKEFLRLLFDNENLLMLIINKKYELINHNSFDKTISREATALKEFISRYIELPFVIGSKPVKPKRIQSEEDLFKKIMIRTLDEEDEDLDYSEEASRISGTHSILEEEPVMIKFKDESLYYKLINTQTYDYLFNPSNKTLSSTILTRVYDTLLKVIRRVEERRILKEFEDLRSKRKRCSIYTFDCY